MLMNPPTLPADYVKAPSYAELVQALELIRHATAPTHDDGGYHEAAHDLADDVLRRVEARKQWEAKNGVPPSYVTRPTPVGAGDGETYVVG